MEFENLLNQIQIWIVTYSLKIIAALILLIVGWIIIRRLMKYMRIVFKKKDFDPSLQTFAYSLIGMSLKILLIITVLGILGVPMTTFIALIGAFGLAVGLALQGSLSNFAGGVLILSFKPYEVGHVVQISSNIGKVTEIQIFNTVLVNAKNETIIIPNGTASNTEVVNFTMSGIRRLDLTFGVAYESNLDIAKKAVLKAASNSPTVIDKDKTIVAVVNLGDSSVDLELRVWVNSPDYITTRDELVESVKRELDKSEIEIPYPKRQLYITKESLNK